MTRHSGTAASIDTDGHGCRKCREWSATIPTTLAALLVVAKRQPHSWRLHH